MRFALLAFLLVAAPAISAPFLISDSWPLTDVDGNTLLQPDSCTAAEGAISKPLALISNGAGEKSIRHDLAGTANGTHNLVITCKNNLWGVASTPVNFPFAAGAPAAPAGFRLVP